MSMNKRYIFLLSAYLIGLGSYSYADGGDREPQESTDEAGSEPMEAISGNAGDPTTTDTSSLGSNAPQKVPPKAAETTAPRVFVGGRLGPSLATLGGPDADRQFVESTYSFGFSIGVSARLAIFDHWSIQSELAYSSRGSGVEVTSPGEESTRPALDYSYIDIALLVQPRWTLPGMGQRLTIHGSLGPSVGYLLEARQGDSDFTESADRVDFGIHGGIGLDVLLPFGTLSYESRYYHGIAGIGGESDLDVSHRNFSFLFGYEVSLGGSHGASP